MTCVEKEFEMERAYAPGTDMPWRGGAGTIKRVGERQLREERSEPPPPS